MHEKSSLKAKLELLTTTINDLKIQQHVSYDEYPDFPKVWKISWTY